MRKITILTFIASLTLMTSQVCAESLVIWAKIGTNTYNKHYNTHKPKPYMLMAPRVTFDTKKVSKDCMKNRMRINFFEFLRDKHPEKLNLIRGYAMSYDTNVYPIESADKRWKELNPKFQFNNVFEVIEFTDFELSTTKECDAQEYKIFREKGLDKHGYYEFLQITKDKNWTPGN